MTETAASPSGPSGPHDPAITYRNPIAAHPITSAAIAILVIADIFFSLYTPLYSKLTPKVGDFPFFYFYLLIFMPITSVALWLTITLQKRIQPPDGASQENSEAVR